MKSFTAPDYCKDFACAASGCKNSCCIGWEIDIDKKTEKKYRKIKGELGRDLKEGIKNGTTVLCENGRCPFLRPDNLCRLICELSEDGISDICKLHPRYFNFTPYGIEWGIGASCEVAANLILTGDERPSESEQKVDGMPSGKKFSKENKKRWQSESKIREKIYSFIFEKKVDNVTLVLSLVNYALKLKEYTLKLLCGVESDIPALDIVSDADVFFAIKPVLAHFSGCEELDEGYLSRLTLAQSRFFENAAVMTSLCNSAPISRLLYYFYHRHFISVSEEWGLYEGCLTPLVFALSVIAFSDTGTDMSDLGLSSVGDPVREALLLFSRNIEYSTENTKIFGLSS